MKYKISNNDTVVLSRPVAKHGYMLSRDAGIYVDVLSRQLKAFSSKGGRIRAAKLTSDQRIDIATKAANVRWSKGEEFNNGLRST